MLADGLGTLTSAFNMLYLPNVRPPTIEELVSQINDADLVLALEREVEAKVSTRFATTCLSCFRLKVVTRPARSTANCPFGSNCAERRGSGVAERHPSYRKGTGRSFRGADRH